MPDMEVTMENNEKLLEAARMIQKHCKHTEVDGICPFSPNGICSGQAHCGISGGRGAVPGEDWKIPQLRRWTDADVNMAKALVSLGYVKVSKYSGKGHPIARDSLHATWYLDSGLFRAINDNETVQLSDIIAEGESQ